MTKALEGGDSAGAEREPKEISEGCGCTEPMGSVGLRSLSGLSEPISSCRARFHANRRLEP